MENIIQDNVIFQNTCLTKIIEQSNRNSTNFTVTLINSHILHFFSSSTINDQFPADYVRIFISIFLGN